jgi:hypothetical protein
VNVRSTSFPLAEVAVRHLLRASQRNGPAPPTIAGGGQVAPSAPSTPNYLHLRADTNWQRLALDLLKQFYPDLIIIVDPSGPGRPRGSRDVKRTSGGSDQSHKYDTGIVLPTGIALIKHVEMFRRANSPDIGVSGGLRRLLECSIGAALKERGISKEGIKKAIKGKLPSLSTRYYEGVKERGAIAADAVKKLPPAHQIEILQSSPDVADFLEKLRIGERHTDYLRTHGIVANDEAQYLAGLFGPEKTELILKSPSDTPALTVLDPGSFGGIFQNSTTRDIVEWADVRARARYITAKQRTKHCWPSRTKKHRGS